MAEAHIFLITLLRGEIIWIGLMFNGLRSFLEFFNAGITFDFLRNEEFLIEELLRFNSSGDIDVKHLHSIFRLVLFVKSRRYSTGSR